MSGRYFSDDTVSKLGASLQAHDAEEFYVEYPEASEPLASELAFLLERAGWAKSPAMVNVGAKIPDKPDFEVETTTLEPEGGVEALIEWLREQNFSVEHNFNPQSLGVAIHVDHSDAPS